VNAPERIQLGLHKTMPASEYHTIAAMSAGGLKRMRVSPAHFYGLQLDPDRPQSTSTPAMRAGTLMHLALFEPHLLDTLAVRPADLDARTKEGKAWLAENSGREIVTAADLATAQRQAAAVRQLPEVGNLLAEGYAEASAFWLDDDTGELCKCRPDWTHPAGSGVILVDGKTCQDASPAGFGRAIWNFGYHLQAAWYSDGFEAATGLQVHGFVFAAVEAGWPHAAAGYMLGDDVLQRARVENRRLLNSYAQCKRTGQWPGYSTGISLVNLPKWAHTEDIA
jgi:hypothetical protein